jgi:hypothetical protein
VAVAERDKTATRHRENATHFIDIFNVLAGHLGFNATVLALLDKLVHFDFEFERWEMRSWEIPGSGSVSGIDWKLDFQFCDSRIFKIRAKKRVFFLILKIHFTTEKNIILLPKKKLWNCDYKHTTVRGIIVTEKGNNSVIWVGNSKTQCFRNRIFHYDWKMKRFVQPDDPIVSSRD